MEQKSTRELEEDVRKKRKELELSRGEIKRKSANSSEKQAQMNRQNSEIENGGSVLSFRSTFGGSRTAQGSKFGTSRDLEAPLLPIPVENSLPKDSLEPLVDLVPKMSRDAISILEELDFNRKTDFVNNAPLSPTDLIRLNSLSPVV